MAVDRSKFRTCDQTSFCRRNRHAKRAEVYSLTDVHFHSPMTRDKEGTSTQRKSSVWERILGGGSEEDTVDPYYRGTTPTLTGVLHSGKAHPKAEKLQWSVAAMADGVARMRVTEVYGHPQTAYEQARVTYDELVLEQGLQAASHARWIRDLTKEPVLSKLIEKGNPMNFMALEYGDSPDVEETQNILLIQLNPFMVSLYRAQDLEHSVIQLNANNMMHYEVRQFRDDSPDKESDQQSEDQMDEEDVKDKPEKEIVGYWEDGLAIYSDGTREEKKTKITEESRNLKETDTDGLWEEKFGDHKDSKPFGPMSVGMDISFPGSYHLYGIPEHASSATLKPTVGENSHYKEPYRLYNLDVFEYELDETMALYGHVPLVVSQSKTSGTSGVFWFNPSETFVDVMESEDGSVTHWISESGVIDIFFIPGPDPKSFYRQYAMLTGTTPIPPMFSLGYHQCRWNYKDEKDVYAVHDKFEELDYPYDVLWLDIEHTDGKRYFTWDSNLFPNPEEMIGKLASQGRRMVTIIDPHIKRDNNYYIHKEATAKGLYIKDKDGKKDYDGWCWPGSSSYLDFTDEKVRNWWAEQFHFDKYKGSTPTLFTWNDMNEPSVFNGPEVSMQKDLKNLAGHEHREWHNLYGMLFHRSTGEGQISRSAKIGSDARPFVLSRSFFAGSQKYGAIWTGDNMAEWGHLKIATPMLLSLNTAALSFVGADVGGFFGNPDAELFTRWMQAGAYQPFFRGHAHHDSKRREPWMFDEDTLKRLRHAAMARYALLPYWYTIFHFAEKTGMPVMRMMWMQYPETEHVFGVDDQFLVGSDLLVKPVTAEGAVEAQIAFPTDDIWYDVETMALASGELRKHGVESVVVSANIDKIPVFQRGGSIIPRKLRLRRSSMLMKNDPYTIYVALDAGKEARGDLYMDDEESHGYREGEFALAGFTAKFGADGFISNHVTTGLKFDSLDLKDRSIERIIIMGVQDVPAKLTHAGSDLDFTAHHDEGLVVVRKPGLSATANWTISVHF